MLNPANAGVPDRQRTPGPDSRANSGGPAKSPPPPPGPSGVTLGQLAFMLIALVVFNMMFSGKKADSIDYSAFKEKIRSGSILRVEMDKGFALGFTHRLADMKKMGQAKGNEGDKEMEAYRTVIVDETGLIRLMDSSKVEYSAKQASGNPLTGIALNWLIPGLIFFGLFRLLSSKMGGMGQGLMSMGKSRAHIVSENEVDVTFDDAAGVDEAKEELREVIGFLKEPRKYAAVGGKIPKGILLVGPPGTGKTLLARAVAGEAKVPFFQISGAEFVEMIVGVGAARVRDMFKEARARAPCIIFIDELDAIGKSRSNSLVSNDEREQTLNQLLVEMQGFDPRSGVIVLAATNRPDVLDPALLRPGRFDRHILVDRPDLEGREAILKRHAREVSMDGAVDLRRIAQRTPGFVGADLANIINEATLLAVRAGRDKVIAQDLEDAIEKVVSGLKKKSRLINPKEKEIVAFHESGHALVAACTPGADKVDKVSIVPRGFGALGFTMQTPTEDRYLMTESELVAKIDVLLGGRAAEKLILGEISTGAANDLTQATEIARSMIVQYGMSEKYKDVVFLRETRGFDAIGRKEPVFQREYAEETQRQIDEQIASIIRDRGQVVERLLAGKKDLLKRVAAELARKESLSGQEFARILAVME